jgi:hypothetical protein
MLAGLAYFLPPQLPLFGFVENRGAHVGRTCPARPWLVARPFKLSFAVLTGKAGLRRLSLVNCLKLNSSTLPSVFEWKNLTHLDLSGCELLDNAAVSQPTFLFEFFLCSFCVEQGCAIVTALGRNLASLNVTGFPLMMDELYYV